MAGLADYNSAARLIEAMANVTQSQIATQVPTTTFATVVSVDQANRLATVQSADGTAPAAVRFLPDDGPWGPGDVVEVSSGRIQRVIFSSTAPGGTYISPAFISMLRGGGATARETFGLYYASNSSTAAAPNAWYVGSFTTLGLAGIAKVALIQAGAGSEVVNYYTFPVFSNQSGGTWVKVAPDIKASLTPTGGLACSLEVMVSTSSLGTSIDFRIRQDSSDTVSQKAPRIEIELFGNWVRDNTKPEVMMTDATPTGYLQGYSDKDKGVWQYINTKNRPPLQNSWEVYGSTFWEHPRYMIDKKGKVRVSGLISHGTLTNGTIIFQLPPGYRPDFDLRFELNTSSSATAPGIAAGITEVNIDTNGNVKIIASYLSANSGYMSLEKIAFFPANSVPWTFAAVISASPSNWSNYTAGSPYIFAPARYYVDPDGIVHWSGMVTGGSVSNPIVALSGSNAPDSGACIFSVASAGGMARLDAQSSNLNVAIYVGAGSNTYVSLEGIEYLGANYSDNLDIRYAHSISGATSEYANGWQDFSSPTYNQLRIYIDSAGWVHLSGLIDTAAGGSAGLSLPIMQPMPLRFWPECQLPFPCIVANVSGRVDVLKDGTIILVGFSSGGSTGFVSLEGIVYLPRV